MLAKKLIEQVVSKVPKLKNKVLKLREAEFDLGRCKNCKLFEAPTTCKIIEGPVTKDQVCDGIQGIDDMPTYKIKDSDKPAFAKGMKKLQPYQHKVVGGYDTPVGWILIIDDTMPEPHRFSLSLDFSAVHTSREHYWNQADVDKITAAGK